MGHQSTIEWTDHTFNPWWGCLKVSPGCQHCYADTLANRYGYNIWGPAATTERRTFGDKHWAEPLKWNREAEQQGQRKRVFCASMADVFEDHQTATKQRPKLWKLIEDTPHLDWLLLTKRPENMRTMAPWKESWPTNVWAMTSVENQEQALRRIPILLEVPTVIHALSVEPLLAAVNLTTWIDHLDWVIVGGESGSGARPMHADWVRSLRQQCIAAGVSFFFKQWGVWVPDDTTPSGMKRMSKKAAGRLLMVEHGMNYRLRRRRQRSTERLTATRTALLFSHTSGPASAGRWCFS